MTDSCSPLVRPLHCPVCPSVCPPAPGGAERGSNQRMPPTHQCGPEAARISACLLGELRARFTPRQVNYVVTVLTGDELAVISDLSDALLFARIKRMPDRRLRQFDQLIPADAAQLRFYQSLQLRWLREEEYLLSTRLGREPTARELFVDFMNHHNGQRFRAYFALKYPERMRPKHSQPR